MIDSFPYEAWDQVSTDPYLGTFWTFGPTNGSAGGDLTGTFVLTALGMLLMVASLVAWVWMENRRLRNQATLLRRASSGQS